MILKNRIYASVQALTPPILFTIYKKSPLHLLLKKAARIIPERKPQWHTIASGPLAGRELLLTNTEVWQQEMLSGTYDSFFFEYLNTVGMSGKIVLEIGAHIGYHALAFAALAGEHGKVVAFEPNPFNATYMKMLLAKNPDLAGRITLHECALASLDGTEEFVFSNNIENGTSSGSFIDSADTIWEKSVYETQTGFKRMVVPVMQLDSLEEIKNGTLRPDIMKIDIEGAEGLMLEGARKTIERYSPLLLIEIHSIKNMYDVLTFLSGYGYTSTVLKKETDGRCFLACHK